MVRQKQFLLLEMCTLSCVFLPGLSTFVWPLRGRKMFRIVASLGPSLFAETLQQRVLANIRMPYTHALYVFNVQSDALNHVLCSLSTGLLNLITRSPVTTGLTKFSLRERCSVVYKGFCVIRVYYF